MDMFKTGRCGRVVILLVLVLLLTTVAALAEDTGKMTVRVHSGDVNVQHAVVEIYRIGDAQIEDVNLVFRMNGTFADSGETLADMKDSGLAGKLMAYARSAGIAPVRSAVTDKNGRATFADLPEGAYLVCQNGFEKTCYFTQFEPFVVTMPMTINGEWSHDITAEPKTEPLPVPTSTPKPTSAPTDPKLPQSGLLRWPMIALSIGGVALFALGWALWFMGKRKKDA